MRVRQRPISLRKRRPNDPHVTGVSRRDENAPEGAAKFGLQGVAGGALHAANSGLAGFFLDTHDFEGSRTSASSEVSSHVLVDQSFGHRFP